MIATVSLWIARITSILLEILFWAVFLRALATWFRPDPYHPVIRFLDRITAPILYPLQRVIPPLGGLDLSPLVAMLLIELLRQLLVHAILRLGG